MYVDRIAEVIDFASSLGLMVVPLILWFCS